MSKAEIPTKEDIKAKVQGELNEWQLCPKCSGTGIVNWINRTFVGDLTCDLCNGKKIISKIDGNPPK